MAKSDWKEIHTTQKHELDYILDKFDKRGTKENREILHSIEKEFKKENSKGTKEELYDYIKKHKDFKSFENKK